MASDGPSRDPRSSLSGAIAAATSGDTLDATLQAIIEAAAAGLGAASGAIFLQDPDRPGLTLAATTGHPDAGRLAVDAQDPSSPFAQAAAMRVSAFDRVAPTPGGGEMLGAYLPLVVSTGGVDSTLGVMSLSWPGPRVLDATEREMLGALAGLTALAVDRARLSSTAAERSEWFERMAHTDPLTGIANERTVGRILELELARAGRQGSEVSLALFDIDDFRAANATGGQGAGDDILRRVAAVLSESVRLVDTVGRIGGDEFVLVAPGSAGALVARRVQDGLAALPEVGGRIVSVSVGVARFPADATDSEGLIAAATDALDRAKAAGSGTIAETETAAEA